MLSYEATKHFRLFKNPFSADISGADDIFMSEEHRYIEAAMLDAARHQGFLAIVGQVGSGKSVIRKKAVMELEKDGKVRLIYPRIIDKTRVTASSLCDAIVLDLNPDAKPKTRLEQKSRQVEAALISSAQGGGISCLLIEEAHDLPVPALKLLKRFHEIEHKYQKTLGIILVGQTELGDRLDERVHPEMREVIQRCQVAQIRGLNGNLMDYLRLKFSRSRADVAKIISEDGVQALSERLTVKDGRKSFSIAYPLTVNNYVTRAMNLAAEMGEPIVSAEVINQL